jgi:transposase
MEQARSCLCGVSGSYRSEFFLKEARRYPVQRILRGIPGFGPLRSAFAIAVIGTPHRFRTKRQLWSYSGLSVVIHTSSDHEIIKDRIVRRQHRHSTRGLTRDFNRILKMVFKGAAKEAIRMDPMKTIYRMKVASGIRPEMATAFDSAKNCRDHACIVETR